MLLEVCIRICSCDAALQGGIVSQRYGTSIAALPEIQQPAAATNNAYTEGQVQTHDQQPLHQHRPQQQQNASGLKPSQTASNWSSQGPTVSQPRGHASHDKPGQSSLQQDNRADQGSKEKRNRRGRSGRGRHHNDI